MSAYIDDLGELTRRAGTDTEILLAVAARQVEITETDRAARVEAVTADAAVRARLDTLRAQRPDDPAVTLLWCQAEIQRAWEVRTRARAAAISQEQIDQFFAILEGAEERLIWLSVVAPDDPLTWHLRLTSARGLSLGPVEARRRYGRLRALEEHHVLAQRQLLQGLLPKWSGTLEDAHAFAHEVASAAPEGSPEAGLIPIFHLEAWLEATDGKDPATFRSPAVGSELMHAADRYLAAPGTSRYTWVDTDSAFAIAFGLGGHVDRARLHFSRLGSQMADTWWSYAANHHASLSALRQQAGVR